MNLNKLKKLYSSSPFLVKKVFSFIPFKIRNGKEYRRWIKYLRSNSTRVNRNPFKTFEYARIEFPFYRNLYQNVNIEKWDDIPLIEKSQIQASLPEFERVPIPKFYVTTGGVTGKPAKFLQSSNVWFKELAFVNEFFGKFGYKPMDLKLSLRGGDFNSLKKDEFWQFNPINNEIQFSPFHLTPNTVKHYVYQINKVQPKFFHSYPSGLLRLSKLMLEKDLKFNYTPECIFLISESFSAAEIKFLKSYFGCTVTSFYGHSERLIFAPYDERTNSFTPNYSYGYFELVDQKGAVIKQNNVKGEIVGTSYDNLAMPLIRYKTGDFSHYIDFDKRTFGPIEGKWGQEFLNGKDGEEVTITALNLHSNELNDLLRLQFIQIEDGYVQVNVQFKGLKKTSELEYISSLLGNRVGKSIKFEIRETNNFIMSSRGKSPLIIRDQCL